MKISLLHPSRNRPKLAAKACRKWLESSVDQSNIEYILSLDTDESMVTEYFLEFKDLLEKIKVIYNPNRSAIDAINNAAKESTGDLLIVVSDDFDCPQLWDNFLRQELKDKEDFIVKVRDGIQDFIITIPIMDRKYYERFNYIYYPEYLHMFCDSELSSVAYMLEKTIYLDAMFLHKHYITGMAHRDHIHIKNDSTWKQGEDLFKARKEINFGLTKFARPYKEGLI